MKRKRKLLAILMAVAMAWQGLSLAQAEELGSSGVASESTLPSTSESSGVPSEEDIRAAQAKSEEAKVQEAGEAQTMALNAQGATATENSKSIAVNITDASYTDKDGNPYNGIKQVLSSRIPLRDYSRKTSPSRTEESWLRRLIMMHRAIPWF